jgi:transcriptional regulator with XRE-family HTH domain
MRISPEQVKAARKLLNLSRGDLALLAGVSEQSIHRFERRTRVPWGATVAAIQRALEAAGIEFDEVFAVRRKSPDSDLPNDESANNQEDQLTREKTYQNL